MQSSRHNELVPAMAMAVGCRFLSTTFNPPPTFLPSTPASKSRPLPLITRRAANGRITSTTTTTAIAQLPPPSKLRARLLQERIEAGNLDAAFELAVEMRSEGGEIGVVVGTSLVDKLLKLGRVGDAFHVFEGMAERNVVTWTSVISGCVSNCRIVLALVVFVEMLECGVLPNEFTFNVAFQACAELECLRAGMQVHSLAIKTGDALSCRIQNCMVHFYSKCGLVDLAGEIFCRISELDVVSFTSMISGYYRNGLAGPASEAFGRMMSLGVEPNEYTVSSILACCLVQTGLQIHGFMIKRMLNQSAFSVSALIDFYSRNGCIEGAELVFEKFDERNVINWSLMISCYLENGHVDKAMHLFCKMASLDINPNEFTYASVIGNCGLCSVTEKLGLQVHGSVIKLNLLSDNRICNALLSMYSRMGKVEESAQVFKEIPDPDVVSWCAVVSGYSQNGFSEKSASLLSLMQRKGLKPNEYGFSSALSSCGDLAVYDLGRSFHGFALKLGCTFDVCVGNALVCMYAKCGNINDAWLAFDIMASYDVTSWNSLIHGYAHHGHGTRALQVFGEMRNVEDVLPDHSTFMGVLNACSHTGYVDEGLKYFKMMDEFGLEPIMPHYACLVDMLGRAGRLEEAVQIIYKMPFEPDSLIWKAVASSCKIHKNIELGKFAAEQAIALEPEDSANYVLFSTMLAAGGEYEGASRARKLMEMKGLKKEVGVSWIDIYGETHSFRAGDRSHRNMNEIYAKLEELLCEMRWEGYSPDLGFTFHDE